jgi:hypothetical protein
LLRRILLLALQTMLVTTMFGCGSSSIAANASPSPHPSPTMTAADRSELATLEARPLMLPTLLKGGVCGPDTQDASTGLWGADPVYVAGGQRTSSSFGDYYYVSAETKPGLTGPVLIRGRDLIAANHPVVFIGPYGAGPVYGTDPRFGTQYTELTLDTTHPTSVVYPVKSANYVNWLFTQGIAKGWTGCVGFQIDGTTFSEDINVNVSTA